MTATAQRVCAWSGVACVVVFLLGFWPIAGFIPPPSPSAGAHEIGEYYRSNQDRIRVGMVVSMIGAALCAPWVAAITVQLRRIEGFSVLVLTQFGMGVILVLEFILFIMFWEVAAFRPDRSDESIQLINDLGWIPFIGLTSTAILQAFVIAAVIFRDKRERPVLPRWAAYFNIWVGLCFMPGTWNCLFKSGPVAWDGLVSFYIAMVAFCSWFLVNAFVVLQAIRQSERDGTLAEAEPPAGASAELAALAAEVAALREEVRCSSMSPARLSSSV
jgi:hypothetical protein